jgi:hypothetical protein
MLHVGANKTVEDLIFASAARNTPTSWMRFGSNVAAIDVAHGMHCAGVAIK